MLVTIDGPSGSGTTSTAAKVADTLGWVWFSAGGDFRAQAYKIIESGLGKVAGGDLVSREDVIKFVESAQVVHDGRGNVTVDGEDVTAHLDLPQVTELVAYLSKESEVREIHNARMREFASKYGDVVFEGRTTGWTFPDALKFWLHVDEAEGLRRVAAQRGHEVAVHNQLRNKMDAERSAQPSAPSPGAAIIDTTNLNHGDAADQILAAVRQQRAAA